MPRKLSKPHTSSSSTASPSLPPSLDPSLPLPKLIVFDLDYTLWPFWVDTHVTPPLRPSASHTSATDKHGEEYAFYADVDPILTALAPLAKLAIASRTSAPGLAKDLLKMLHVDEKRALDVFSGGMEIYPGSKVRHMEALQRRNGVRYEDVLFFDDESRNQETEKLGLTMCLVRDGLCWGELVRGVDEWRRRRGFGRPSVST